MATDSAADSPARRVAKAALGGGIVVSALVGYQIAKFRRTASEPFKLDDPPAPGTPDFDRLMESVTGAPVRAGNRVHILRNGCETFPAMLKAIAAAKQTIDLSSYIYWPGGITDQFTEALCHRASAGVEVNVLLDGWGSARHDSGQVDRLERAGATVAFFRTPRWYTLHKFNNRMHRRLLIVDGKVGFAGGVGIADVWTGNAQDPEHWRETHARIEGPAVREILGGFAENWTEATRRILGGRHTPDLVDVDGGCRVQVTRSSATTGANAAAEQFYAAIIGARERLWLTTAYFTAGPTFLDALADRARRGVDVRILVNGPNVDKDIVRKTGQHAYGGLLEAGVRVFEYQPTMLHAKVLIADGWANVGSANFDRRSLALDAELNVSVSDPGLVKELARHFVEDLQHSSQIDLEAWRSRPFTTRAVEYAGQLLRQSL